MRLKDDLMNLSKNELWLLFRRYLLVVIPLILVYVSIVGYINYSERQYDINAYNRDHQYQTELVSFTVTHFYSEAVDSSEIIENSNEMQMYLDNPNATTLAELEQLFYRIVINIPDLEHVRLLDNLGNETIHIKKTDTQTQIHDNLENKSDEIYFQEAITLQDESYISPVTLLTDNDEIVTPYEEVIYVSTPLYNNGSLVGVLALTANAHTIYESLDNIIMDESSVTTALVDEDGYYLYHSTNDKEFGWLIPERSQSNVMNDYDNTSDIIFSDSQQQHQTQDYVLYHSVIDPFHDLEDISTDYDWVMMTVIDDNYFDRNQDHVLFYLTGDDLIVIGLGIILSLILATIYYLRKKDLTQLNIMKNITDQTTDIVVISDENQMITYVNEAFENKTGYRASEVIGKSTKVLQSGLHSPEFYHDMWEDINQRGSWTGELWEKTKEGIYYPKRMTISALPSNDRRVGDTYVSISSDLTDIREHQKHLVNMIHSNNSTINKQLLTDLCHTSIDNNTGVFGIVNVQILNVSNVYLSGDSIQEHITQAVISLLKEKVGQNGFIAQVDKRTFILGVSDYETEQDIMEFARQLINNDLSMISVDKRNVYISAVAGIATYPSPYIDIYSIIEASYLARDYALDHSEQKYYKFTKDIQVYYEREAKLALLLREAIDNGELTMYYQPQYDALTDTIIGAEALIRWYNDELGHVSPLELITVAEKTGYIVELGHWIIKTTFEQMSKINQAIDKPIKISINISPYQFKDVELVDLFKTQAKTYHIDLKHVEIEITESVFAKNLGMINEKLKEFSDLGISIAVDDFGTGFSSLQYLQDLNVDRLKIDRSFIKDYPEKHSGRVTKGIVNLARQMKLDPICEGVETEAQRSYLLSIDCIFHQGYFYQKAVPIDDLITLITE